MPAVINDLQAKVHEIPGIKTFMKSLPLLNLDVGTSAAMGNYQYTLQGIDRETMYSDAEKVMVEMRKTGLFTQVISDMHNEAPYANISIDRNRAYDLNVSAQALEFAFMYAYAGGKLSLINGIADQYYVIIETLPKRLRKH